MDVALKTVRMKNFLSFNDICFDLTGKKGEILKYAFVYGENGSGKTNLLQSLSFLKDSSETFLRSQNTPDVTDIRQEILKVLGGMNVQIDVRPQDVTSMAAEYHLIGAQEGMALEYVFDIGGSNATYRMEFDQSGKLTYESLDSVINVRKGNVFTIDSGSYKFNSSLFSAEYRKIVTDLLDRYWGKHTLLALILSEYRNSNQSYMRKNVSGNLLDFLRCLDSVVVAGKNHIIIDDYGTLALPSGAISKKDSKRLDTVEGILSRFFTRLYSDVRSVYFSTEETENGLVQYSLIFKKRIAGEIRDIPADRESSGTKRLINVLPYLLDCADGKIVLIDEIDSGVHDVLMRDLLHQAIPDVTGQLIATSHNTLLLEESSADNAYVIRIDRKGFKDISPLASIERPHKGTSVAKRYVAGCYSGIPLIADVGLRDILEYEKRTR